MPFDTPPTRADLFAWVGGVDVGTPGDVYDLALETAALGQGADCIWELYTADLHAAALRRAARVLAARGLALGRMEGGDFGPAFVPQWDAEIERYEKDYRRGPFA